MTDYRLDKKIDTGAQFSAHAHFRVYEALVTAPGLSMLTRDALKAITTLVVNSLTEEVPTEERPLRSKVVDSDTLFGVTYVVREERDFKGEIYVTCNCPSFVFGNGNPCKHIQRVDF